MQRKARQPTTIRTLERQRIALPAAVDTPFLRQRLLDIVGRAGIPNALQSRQGGLWAGDVVGVVDAGNVVIEILPKIGLAADLDGNRDFLIRLLWYVGRDRSSFATAAANIGDGERGLLEVLLAWAVREIGKAATVGVPKRYEPRTETSTAVRGRIDLKRIALARPGRAFELTIHHAPMSVDNDLGRLARWLVREIFSITRRIDTRRSAAQLLNDLAGISDVEAREAAGTELQLHPLEEHWRPVLTFARALASQRSLDPGVVGENPSVAVLFTLHDLFERALRRVFRERGPHHGFGSGRIPRHLLIGNSGDLAPLKPDYVLVSGEGESKVIGIGDAKWKDVWRPDGRPDPAEADLYQLAAYMTASRAGAGFLFTPLAPDPTSHFRAATFRLAGAGQRVDVVGVHLPTLIADDERAARLRAELCCHVRGALDAPRALSGGACR